jgi:hypothetical protein
VNSPHAAVWLNADEAHIFRFGAGEVEKCDVRASEKGHAPDRRAYFEAILADLSDVEGSMMTARQKADRRGGDGSTARWRVAAPRAQAAGYLV